MPLEVASGTGAAGVAVGSGASGGTVGMKRGPFCPQPARKSENTSVHPKITTRDESKFGFTD
ncbi:hypothetical protein HNR39_003476 [Glaciimonas immobilis]|uniref:Uncharacterized protein n=1 Tax=Glaciimonas immobilis TaxID=728004 RepID=A0A840RVJ9_9BURK|nr:hypothetical protein [Glaciimonas immobilis]